MQLTGRQIVQDNALASEDISIAQLVHCARGCGLKAKAVTLDWNGLTKLDRALPAILRLKNGAFLLLEFVESNDDRAIAGLRDPKSSPDANFVVDRPHLEEAWGGEVILLRGITTSRTRSSPSPSA